MLARLEAAECNGSVRALSAQRDQGGPTEKSVELFDLFSDPANTNDSVINQVLAVLQEEVQNWRDEVSRKRKCKGKKNGTSSDLLDGSSSSDSEPEFVNERKLMRLKAYEKIKVPSLRKSAADLRTWKVSDFPTRVLLQEQ